MSGFGKRSAIVGMILAGWLEGGSAATFTTLHSFTGSLGGGQPLAGLVEGSDSNFYGTTSTGGFFDNGTFYNVLKDGTFNTLHNFVGGLEGANPRAPLIQAGDGNFYGTTLNGGTGSSGTVFKITTAGTLTTVHSFGGAGEGSFPVA